MRITNYSQEKLEGRADVKALVREFPFVYVTPGNTYIINNDSGGGK